MQDDPEYNPADANKELLFFKFSDSGELTIILDAKDAPITATTLPIFVGPDGVLPLEIGVRADTPKGSTPLLRGKMLLEGGVVPSPDGLLGGGVGIALWRAMRDSLLEEVLKMLPASMSAESFVIDQTFIDEGGFFQLATPAKKEPLSVYIPRLPFQDAGMGYRLAPDDDSKLLIATDILDFVRNVARRQRQMQGLDPSGWAVKATVSYRT